MIAKLNEQIKIKNAPVVVGLDPTLAMIPDSLKGKYFDELGESLEAVCGIFSEFNRAIIDATYDLIPAVKPQIAMYEAFGIPGLVAYRETVEYAKSKGLIVIGDAKRGDIGSTSKAYADAHIGQTTVGNKSYMAFDEDFVTVNPYLGTDGVKPFIDVCNECDKGIFVLIKTSNPSSGEFQDRIIEDEGKPLYELVANKVSEWGALSMDGEYSNVGAVVGATYPEMAKTIRGIIKSSMILVPGYGAQGGKGEDLKPFFNDSKKGAIVNSSRGIIAAWQQEKYKDCGGEAYMDASRMAVEDMLKDIRGALQ